MKCTDLQIDDYVMFDGSVYQVQEISKDGWVHITYSDGTRVRMSSDYIIGLLKGVHLTPEILEKNGFKYHKGEIGMYGVQTSSYYSCSDIFRLYDDGNPFSVWFEEEVNVKFVHQLQHILRLCNIDKQIIL